MACLNPHMKFIAELSLLFAVGLPPPVSVVLLGLSKQPQFAFHRACRWCERTACANIILSLDYLKRLKWTIYGVTQAWKYFLCVLLKDDHWTVISAVTCQSFYPEYVNMFRHKKVNWILLRDQSVSGLLGSSKSSSSTLQKASQTTCFYACTYTPFTD